MERSATNSRHHDDPEAMPGPERDLLLLLREYARFPGWSVEALIDRIEERP